MGAVWGAADFEGLDFWILILELRSARLFLRPGRGRGGWRSG